jgi:hypothetical protein
MPLASKLNGPAPEMKPEAGFCGIEMLVGIPPFDPLPGIRKCDCSARSPPPPNPPPPPEPPPPPPELSDTAPGSKAELRRVFHMPCTRYEGGGWGVVLESTSCQRQKDTRRDSACQSLSVRFSSRFSSHLGYRLKSAGLARDLNWDRGFRV